MKKMHVSAVVWRTSSILIVLVLLTAYLTSYLAARFASSKDGEDGARVAKWGYTLTVADDAAYLFGSEYADLDSNAATAAKVKTDDFTGKLSVKSENIVVTPNSSGYMTFTYTRSTESEVMAKFWAYCDHTMPSIKENGVLYQPIKWTLTSKNNLEGTTATHLTGGTLEQAVAVLNGIGTMPTTELDMSYTLSWEWPLESGHDAADTALMLAAAGSPVDTAIYTDIQTAFTVDLTLSIEQIN